MTQLTTAIHSSLLSQGVSTQPRHLRFPGQVEDSLNVAYSPRTGAWTRKGTWKVGNIAQPAVPIVFYRSTMVRRPEAFGGSALDMLYVWDLVGLGRFVSAINVESGDPVPIRFEGTLGGIDPIEEFFADFRFRTVSDTTFLVSVRTPASFNTAPEYVVSSTHDTFERMVDFTPAADQTYHRTLADSEAGPAGYWRYDVAGETYAVVQTTADPAKDVIEPGEGSVVADYTGLPDSRAGVEFWFVFENVPRDVTHPVDTILQGDFSDKAMPDDVGGVGRVALSVRLENGQGGLITPGWYKVASITPTSMTLATSPGGTSQTGVVVVAEWRTEHRVVIPVDVAFEDMHQVSRFLQREAQDASGLDILVSWIDLGGETGRFAVTSPYRSERSGAFEPQPLNPSITGVHDLVSGQGVRPFAAKHFPSSTTAGTGARTGNMLAPSERYKPVPAPGDPNSVPNVGTLPVTIKWDPVAFEYVLTNPPWKSRESGTNVSNPGPEPLTEGQTVHDVAVVGNRLALLTQNAIVFSGDGDLFQLYPEDAFNPTSSDAFWLPLPGRSATGINAMAPIRGGLMASMASGVQYEVRQPFTLTGVQVVSTGQTRTIDGVPPEQLNDRLLFAGENGGSGAVYEYVFTEQTGDAQIVNVSRHAADIVPTTIGRIAVSGSSDVALLKTGGNGFLLYHSVVEGGRRIQAAFSRHALASVSTILDVVAERETVYLSVSQGTNSPVLWKMDLSEEEGDVLGLGYEPRLDGMLQVTGTYDLGDDETTFVYGRGVTHVNRIVRQNGEILTDADPGWSVDAVAGTVVYTGDVSGEAILGVAFESWIEPTPPIPRLPDGQPDFSVRLMVERVTVMLDEDATPANSGTTVVVNRPDGMVDSRVGMDRAGPPGALSVSTRYAGESSALRIEMDSHKPVRVQGVVYVGTIAER